MKWTPQDIDYETEFDKIYVQSLQQVTNEHQFQEHLDNFRDWLDADCLTLTGKDWPVIQPMLEEIKPEHENKQHDFNKLKPALALAIPEKIIKVSIVAIKYKVPWGVAYIQMNGSHE